MSLLSQNFDYDILVCADTVVVAAHGEILEKPTDASNAMQMLLELSNNTCRVYTSCILSYRVAGQPRRVVTHVEQTELTFHPLQQLDIAAYIDTGEPFGKSGKSCAMCVCMCMCLHVCVCVCAVGWRAMPVHIKVTNAVTLLLLCTTLLYRCFCLTGHGVDFSQVDQGLSL
jgi:hypothetical protein